jgi:CBS domain-containing protein
MKQSLQCVADVMRPGVVVVSRSTTLDGVARVMREHHVHGVLVTADDGELLGWVTARGLLRHSEPGEWRRSAAHDAISEPCISVVPSATVAAARDAMLAADVSRLAVLRPGSRVPDGVVAEIDLVGHLSR